MARPRLGLGLGDPRSENGFNDTNMRFARQLGCTDVILEVPYDLSDAPNPDSVLDGSAGFSGPKGTSHARRHGREHTAYPSTLSKTSAMITGTRSCLTFLARRLRWR